ncbi:MULTISPECIES: flagellar protein FlgN [unclassified Pseudomonas]|uniref:flagella synthesis protein FlgN n=1 Tax=unclassified Pseudomonas TaxID=196821 RepID=UPI002AC9A2A0|nr:MULTISPECIES: flagellar protein FlgN [unclassified Pseudomonas]MEB0041386.1 flagellar protein FlgN [Pseudomonas sp. MH10]MEB0078662.1 flagellar protein FlgN [Pseudomonas sp. MH10out]MEB0093952.1 flagellar protein FlgN [Pseudomonas sp. CCI4.2]MEB0103726.1 flagellar protein FlgN [Pseudomonas sp. CCI3.2]MEB0121199.1 flagellar protein FlgN [Pseudomonas sp. CCI1.2]
MHDTTLLQLINDDMAPAQHLLELLQAESLALHGRDLFLLEEILAQKQALVIMLEQRGRKRSQILIDLKLSPDRDGLVELAGHSSVGEALLTQGDMLAGLMSECRTTNQHNGVSIQLQQATTANQMKILTGGDAPTLYDNRGSTSRFTKPRPLSQA